ncbi:hypothetical protein BB561_001942 [Smittium simulii]|uniref:PB1 domain-containing protein n=1 Tax=Smittium simulii TaxID=133385 RepID=A0A2T9YSB8_9FUNG|nr:hypothetical protein BB561_001942 [Smittium simulii]
MSENAPVVIKFIYKGPEYYRYYWENRSTIAWGQLVDGLRLLYGIAEEVLTLVYKDSEGENVLVTNQHDLKFMLNMSDKATSLKVMVMVGSVHELLKNAKNKDMDSSQPSTPKNFGKMKIPTPEDYISMAGSPQGSISERYPRPLSPPENKVNPGILSPDKDPRI